jgi:hypothetical protein
VTRNTASICKALFALVLASACNTQYFNPIYKLRRCKENRVVMLRADLRCTYVIFLKVDIRRVTLFTLVLVRLVHQKKKIT